MKTSCILLWYPVFNIQIFYQYVDLLHFHSLLTTEITIRRVHVHPKMQVEEVL